MTPEHLPNSTVSLTMTANSSTSIIQGFSHLLIDPSDVPGKTSSTAASMTQPALLATPTPAPASIPSPPKTNIPNIPSPPSITSVISTNTVNSSSCSDTALSSIHILPAPQLPLVAPDTSQQEHLQKAPQQTADMTKQATKKKFEKAKAGNMNNANQVLKWNDRSIYKHE
ncbi:hypothetical protein H2248_011585 [Termitomyces sp. 'cryptogamus']|nr:hypothetical protein H2248_011585 [Termitomyces sp. 'cryptogamus']